MGMRAKHFITLINNIGCCMIFYCAKSSFCNVFFCLFKFAVVLTDQDGNGGLLGKMYKLAHARECVRASEGVCVCACVCVCVCVYIDKRPFLLLP